MTASGCCPDITRSGREPPKIYFEFDVAYGATPFALPPRDEEDDAVLGGEHVTRHRREPDGFEIKMDSVRMEVATRLFTLDDAGHADMGRTMARIVSLMGAMSEACRRAAPNRALHYPPERGAPRAARPPELDLRAAVKWVYPIRLRGHDPHYRAERSSATPESPWGVWAAPQATFELPLARIEDLVHAIRASEQAAQPGVSWSGPAGQRQGNRSQALYDALDSVNRSFREHIENKSRVGNGVVVSRTTFSPALKGFLVLLVSYLRTSLLNHADDYEQFAKAYLPLNVKNPMRLLFSSLTQEERAVFTGLYDSPRERLWQLVARRGDRGGAAGANRLFPERVQEHQSYWFKDPLTWDQFVDRTIHDQALERTVRIAEYQGDYLRVTRWQTRGTSCVLTLADGTVRMLPAREVGSPYDHKYEELGCEVLWAPLSRIRPYQTGSRRATVEMRRIAWNWVPLDRWMRMTSALFELARRLNR